MQINEGTTTIAPVEGPLEEGWTLPASWYSDPNVRGRGRAPNVPGAWAGAGPPPWGGHPGRVLAAPGGPGTRANRRG